ncbi:Putative signal transducing protein [Halpernia humi]|uniref:Putative signal transducing protein n=2 Tax=Halpernia humi TaxID=493375 RepID=A0A1H5T8C4_9FLAO|nr:Putative signal transducing protein [Halpernia humi]
MEKMTRVSVFESTKQQELQLIKSKLEEQNITATIENSYLTFLTTPTATNMRVMVSLKDEQEAFKIIDDYIKETDLEITK